MKALNLSSIIALFARAAIAQAGEQSPKPVMLPLSSDDSFSFQMQVMISLAEGGATNTGEVLRAASRIKPGDFESFYDELYLLGTKIHDIAEGFDPSKYPVSARDTYFRSASYYRMSTFYLIGNTSDPRLYDVYDQATSDFDKAISLMDVPGVRYNISAPNVRPNFTAPIIFYKAKNCNESTPTVLWGTGYDAPQENGLPAFGKYVLDRGWNFVSYEGPGQNTPRRQQNIGFIPNWWDVVTPIVDFLSERPDVDMSKLALVGESFGGILAPRVATREKRFAGVIAIDGAYSLEKVILDNLPEQLVEAYQNGEVRAFDDALNSIRNNVTYPTDLRWAINQGLWTMDTESPYEWLKIAGQIEFTEEMAQNITTPFFIGNGQDDTLLPGQAAKVAQWLGDKAYLYNFTNDVGAGLHCQIGAEGYLSSVSLNWLADVFCNSTTEQKKAGRA